MKSLTMLDELLARFAAAEFSWISSARPDGRMHSVPVWHIWADERAYVVTTGNTVKIGNIASNPNVVIALPDPVDPLIIEGVASLKPAIPPEVAAQFQVKYSWNPASDASYSTLIEITPSKVIAWGKHGEGRWTATDIRELHALTDIPVMTRPTSPKSAENRCSEDGA